jgi:phosphohistidine swiveling domain-containing protein
MQKVQSFSEITEETIRFAGGKGGTLAQLYQRGYPVPDGFVVLTQAFNEEGLLPEAWEQVKEKLNQLREGNVKAFAVRSSALSEDSSETSFAGEFETVLGVQSEEEILEAIQTVWSSRSSERVQSYNEIHGFDREHEIAVIVQSLVDSEYAGVLFTVDPVTGKHTMLGNYVQGLGDKLVSGEADARDFTFERPDGTYQGPKDLEPYGGEIYQTALKLEEDLSGPQDIEWAVAANKFYLLQSRPITTHNIHDPKKGYYNFSLLGDYLWNSTGIGENLPGIMMPSTWSIWKIFFFEILEWEIVGLPAVGNISGRPYVNTSLMLSLASKVYGRKRGQALLEPAFGRMPDATMPIVDISWGEVLRIIPKEFAWQMKVRRNTKKIPKYIKTNPGRCKALIEEIKNTDSLHKLHRLWRDEIKPLFVEGSYMLKTINEHYQMPWITLAGELKKLVGKQEADLLMSTVGNTSEELESLGVMIGVSEIAKGELSREDYLEGYGHRFPDEWHLQVPRPYENPNWLDEQIHQYEASPFDLSEITRNQRKKFEDAWVHFQKKYPGKSKKIRKQVDRFASLSVDREHIRSEMTRSVCVIREMYLRAGELTGLKEDVFFLTYPELEEVFDGNNESLEYISARRETDHRLRELPEFPSVISGAFNPFTWAKNPNRRIDVFDSHRQTIEDMDPSTIHGNPGSGGVFEGIVRVINLLEEGHLLQNGEILVTSTTNIGWTPLFPRASAVVTDIGMPLAHAAIVAREIGIPAVVGCGNATTRLKTGDRVQVDGDQGVVRLLDIEA